MAQPSYIGLWNYFWKDMGKRTSTEKDPVAEKALKFINDDLSIRNMEDWGAGSCISAKYVRADIDYEGIDGADISLDVPYKITKRDLTKYTSSVDAILMKHVLEHNPAWETVLDNVCKSFTKKAVIVLFTPLNEDDKDETIKFTYSAYNDKNELVKVPDLSLSKKKFINVLGKYKDITYTEETVNSDSAYKKDTFFYLSRN